MTEAPSHDLTVDVADASRASNVGAAARDPGSLAAAMITDAARLAAVRETGLLDSAAEPAFDRLTRLAVRLLGVPAAFFSLVDETRDFYKSACGFGEPLAIDRELRGPTFCHYAIQSREPLVIPDTAADPLYRDVPTVRTLGVAAYIGIPIVVREQVIGSFCVIDTVPRAWTAEHVEILTELAASAQREIDLRGMALTAEKLTLELQEQAVELEAQQAELEQQMEEARSVSEELRRSAEALEIERNRLTDAFRDAPSFLAVLCGPRHEFSLVNEAYYQLVGYRDLIGNPLLAALPELSGQGFDDILRGVFETGEPFVGRELPMLVRRVPDGEPDQRFVDFVCLPLIEERKRTGVIAHGTDVTQGVVARHAIQGLLDESEAARRNADEARADAEKATRTQSAFLATMSHEFRTPLNAIGGYAQLLELEIGGPLSAQQRDQLGRLRAANDHMLGLVNDVLDLAKLNAGALTVHVESSDMNAPVTAAITLTAPQAATRNVALVNAAAEPGVVYVGDEQRVRQVLVNLLSNAVKFSKAGGDIEVASRLEATTPARAQLMGEGPWAVVHVRDTGIGIALEDQATVFAPFKQVDSAHTRTKGGTGLGLAISRRLARLMGGDLTLDSTPGAGSTFSLWLPSARSDIDVTTGATVSETPSARSERAIRPLLAASSLGLPAIGARLHEEIDQITAGWVARLWVEPGYAAVRAMDRTLVESHIKPFLSSVIHALMIIEAIGGLDGDLLRDSSSIQGSIAEHHGRQRRRVGWTETQVAGEYRLLSLELADRIRNGESAQSEASALAVGVVERFLVHARDAAVQAFRRSDD